MENKESSEGHPRAIGIDLGTTNSCVAVWEYDHVQIIDNDEGNRTTPSYVSFTGKEKLVGDAAQRNAYMDPINTIYSVKRFIGRRFSDPIVQKDINLFPFTVLSGANDRLNFSVQHGGEEKQFSAEEISSMILMKMKQIAEKYLHCAVKDAVITVPAYFSDSQRRATKNAGIIAGLNVKRIMDEPTAAALAYGFHKIQDYSKSQNVFVFDLGGGTFDASLVKICGGNFEVKAIAGDSHLGGEDFDNRLLIYFVEEFKTKHNKDITTNPRALRRLKGACERAKRTLSTTTETTVLVDYILPDQDFYSKISQNIFNELNKDLFEKCITLTGKCLEDAKVDKSDVDLVVLTGGSSRIPKVQELLKEYFGDKILHTGINEDEAVAYGAALQAAKLSERGGDILNTIVLTDVTPLSLGVKLLGDVMCPIISRNTPVPTKKVKFFTTCKDNQTSIAISVYEGERFQASGNNLLGRFEVSRISPSPRRVPKIDVCFEVDADGILNVSVAARDNSEMSTITITNEESWLRKEEIDKMINDAEKSKTEDEEHERKHDAWNKLDKYIINTRRTMIKQELMSLTSESERKKIEDKISEVISWLHKNRDPLPSVEASQSKLRELEEMCEPIISKMD